MSCAILGALIGALVSMFGIFIAQRTGYLQIQFTRKKLELDVLLATPKIGTHISVEERHDNGVENAPLLHLITTIQNEGQLPVSQLNGHWNLSSSHGISEHTIPITREFLGSNPYQLEYRIGQSVGSNIARQQFRFDVDIEFDYLLPFPKDKPAKYEAKYEYDPDSGKMVHRNEVLNR
jgi:hypothetical protein